MTFFIFNTQWIHPSNNYPCSHEIIEPSHTQSFSKKTLRNKHNKSPLVESRKITDSKIYSFLKKIFFSSHNTIPKTLPQNQLSTISNLDRFKESIKQYAAIDFPYDYAVKRIQSMEANLVKQVKEQNIPFLYIKIEGFDRPLQIFPNGQIWVHLTKTHLKGKVFNPKLFNHTLNGDICFGKGSSKKARAAIPFNGPLTGQVQMIASLYMCQNQSTKAPSLKDEIDMLKKTNSIKGIIRFHNAYYIQNKFGFEKCLLNFEFADLGTLASYLIEKGFTYKELLKITLTLINTLNSLEKHQILHRDLKLDNILLKSTNKGFEVVISDMGSSCYSSDLVALSSVAGHPKFLSPEVNQAKLHHDSLKIIKASTHKMDVWSLGVILHYLQFKQHPNQNLFFKPTNILEEIIASCLKKDINSRPLATDLKKTFEKQLLKELKSI